MAGVLALIANNASAKWAVVIILAAAASTVALLINDIRKLVLMAFVIDIPLGLDIALQDQEWHRGGPTGYIVSLMTIALIVGYALWIVGKRPKPRLFPQTTIPALLYLFMVVLSFYQSGNLQLSSFGLFLHCQLFLMYLYIANHVRTRADLRLIMLTVVVCLLLESALMVMQYFLGVSFSLGAISSISYQGLSAGVTGPRVGGTLGTYNTAAAYLASMLTITFGVYLTGKLVDKRLAFLTLSLGIVALIFTASRSAWASLFIAVLIVLSQAIRKDVGKKAILALLAGSIVVGIFFGGQILLRLEATATDRTRPELATMAYNIIKEYPLGVGENNYDQVMGDRYAHPNWVGRTHQPVHNKYLLVWSETGPQGLVAFVLLLIAAAWQAGRWLFQSKKPAHLSILFASFLGALVGYALHMTTEGFASRANVQILWFIIAMIVAVDQLVAQTDPATAE